MRRVLLSKLLSIERAAEAAKRGGGTTPLSLDRPLESGEDDDLTLGGLIPHPGPGPDDDAQAAELRERIEDASRLLTPRQQRLIQGLYADRSVSDLSRVLGVPRPTLYDDLRRIQQVFRNQGLEEYLW
jgi:RNA polymerase sigma-70 factor (ECF subfamily)